MADEIKQVAHFKNRKGAAMSEPILNGEAETQEGLTKQVAQEMKPMNKLMAEDLMTEAEYREWESRVAKEAEDEADRIAEESQTGDQLHPEIDGPIDYDELSNPFEDDWDDLPDELHSKYYDQCSKEAYAEWCEANPLSKKVRPYLIDDLIPANQCHIVCGESGAQKTSIMLTLLDLWRQGKEVLGRKSHPVPMMYIAYDRGKAATEETFETLDLDHRLFGYHEVTMAEYDLDPIELIRKLKQQNPSVGLFLIEGLMMVTPDTTRRKSKKGHDIEIKDPYKVTSRWLREIDFLCGELGITIIGVTHAAKGGGAEHAGRRTRTLGTVATPATTGTTFIADLVNDRRTCFTIRPRSGPKEVWYFERASDGKMALVDIEAEKLSCFDRFLAEASDSFTRKDVQKELDVSEATAGRYLKQAKDEGLITCRGNGKKTTYSVKKAA